MSKSCGIIKNVYYMLLRCEYCNDQGRDRGARKIEQCFHPRLIKCTPWFVPLFY